MVNSLSSLIEDQKFWIVNMGGSDENNPGLIRQANLQGGLHGGVGKIGSGTGHNRKPLGSINRNIIAPPPYHCVANKRGLSEKHGKPNKIPHIHRPITRKYAAETASKQKTDAEAWDQSIRPAQNTTKSIEDCTIIDVDEFNRDTGEDLVPMFVQHTEAMLDEIDHEMEEAEMVDITEEPVANIDSLDKKNPLAVVEYIDELHDYYRKSEISSCVSPNYMVQQLDINERMRGILIDWLIEVHFKFELMEETLYLTVNLIDRFLAVQTVVRKELQLVGITAMLLACKYEEVLVPVVEDLILISDKAYSRKDVLEMEKLMVKTFQFNLSVPTPYVFMRRFLKAAQSDKELELMSFFMAELCLVEYETLKFPPSMLAAAAIFTAQSTLVGSRQWSKTTEWYSKYSEEQLLECSRLMVTFHQKAGSGKLTGVFRKYNTHKFGYAAKTEPAQFLL